MTTAEWVSGVKDLLAKGGNYGLSDALIRSYLNRAKREVEQRTLCTFHPDVGILIASGVRSYDLTDETKISKTSGCSVRKILRMWMRFPGCDLHHSDVAALSWLRGLGSVSGTPRYYVQSWRRDLGSGTQEGILLELYPAPDQSASDLDSSPLRCDIVEDTPNISLTQDPLTPGRVDDLILLNACKLICQSFGDARMALFERQFRSELEIQRQYYNDISSGDSITGIAK